MMTRFFKKAHGLIAVSGLIWLGIGLFLLTKGLFQLVSLLFAVPESSQLSHWMLSHFGTIEKVILVFVGASLFFGLLKAKLLLSKVVEYVVHTIVSQRNSLSLRILFTARYLRLIVLMMMLGLSLKWLGLPLDIQGIISVTIGSALINGSFLYFRISLELARRYL